MLHVSLKKRNLLLNATIAVLLVAVVGGIIYWLWWGQSRLLVVGRAPDFTLESLEGTPVQFSEYSGKVRVVEFMFTNCPDICPITTANLVEIQKELKEKEVFGNKVNFFAITFDPARDTPEVLREYASTLKLDQNGWVILRGGEEETRKIVESYGGFVEKQPDGSFAHSIRSLVLVDQNNNIRKVYQMGQEMPTDEVRKDILSLVNEHRLFWR